MSFHKWKNGFPTHGIIVKDSKSDTSRSYNIKLFDQAEFDSFLAKGLDLLHHVHNSTENATKVTSGEPRFNFSSDQQAVENPNIESAAHTLMKP